MAKGAINNRISSLSKLAALILILLCSNSMLKAQTHYASRVSVGVKGGVDFSRIFFNPSVTQKMAMGAVAGLQIKYVEESHFGLIAELNLEQRGWKEDFEETQYSYKRTVNYIQIPVLAHIYFGNRGQFFFNAGPEIGFKIGESTSTNFDVANISSLPDMPSKKLNTDEMFMDADQKIDYGISVGLGGEFFVNPRHSVLLEARFYYGLGNVLKSGRQESFSASNSMSVMATLGYFFRIK
jgi:hypothetical protein